MKNSSRRAKRAVTSNGAVSRNDLASVRSPATIATSNLGRSAVSATRARYLGSGAGFDSFIEAGPVGPGGRVAGVDMTPEIRRGGRHVRRRQGRGHAPRLRRLWLRVYGPPPPPEIPAGGGRCQVSPGYPGVPRIPGELHHMWVFAKPARW